MHLHSPPPTNNPLPAIFQKIESCVQYLVVSAVCMGVNATESIATRQSLLARLKDKEDQASWQTFFDTYWRLIYAISIKAGLSEHEAEDVVQETVISVARKIDGFVYDPAVCSFKTWMLRLTRWRIINQLKKRWRDAATLQPAEAEPLEAIADPMGVKIESIWEEEWQNNVLTTAMERVKQQVRPEHFQIFDLAFMEGWPVSKIKQTLHVAAAQVYLVKHRISRLLKKEIQKLQSGGF